MFINYFRLGIYREKLREDIRLSRGLETQEGKTFVFDLITIFIYKTDHVVEFAEMLSIIG